MSGQRQFYQLLADGVLVLHVALVLFVIGGLLLVWWGHRPWAATASRLRRRVDDWRFRLAHLATIGVVVAESWLGIECPLTTLEVWLRVQARSPHYRGSFIEHWLQALLFWHAPAWVFTTAYTLFALAVVLTWWRWPPRPR